MVERNYSHQDDFFNPANARSVTLIGCGSVGSMVAYTLDKMGVPTLEIWDGDKVDSHNCPMSFYDEPDIGRFKVDVLAERLRNAQVVPHRAMYAGEALTSSVVIACVDTMVARKLIWERVKMVPSVALFCDTRTAELYVEVLTVSPCEHEDIGNYEQLLYGDEKAVRQSCGRHGLMTVSMRAAQVVASNLAAFWQDGRKTWRVGERTDIHHRAF